MFPNLREALALIFLALIGSGCYYFGCYGILHPYFGSQGIVHRYFGSYGIGHSDFGSYGMEEFELQTTGYTHSH